MRDCRLRGDVLLRQGRHAGRVNRLDVRNRALVNMLRPSLAAILRLVKRRRIATRQGRIRVRIARGHVLKLVVEQILGVATVCNGGRLVICAASGLRLLALARLHRFRWQLFVAMVKLQVVLHQGPRRILGQATMILIILILHGH